MFVVRVYTDLIKTGELVPDDFAPCRPTMQFRSVGAVVLALNRDVAADCFLSDV
jgi:hypothetical protein